MKEKIKKEDESVIVYLEKIMFVLYLCKIFTIFSFRFLFINVSHDLLSF